ncbi:hypothetical protein FA13DRAFT_1733260 [Coprinellus micaceus]|uniref:Ubiquitin-like domain-containing protein n=1 Tax=Coprinellus micaceus TaxID=71717 RepID=A0A4Y7TA86_COPMI|nr:hypothetical protein FA13DRAFT_1733260 [Coprinellus micaceus]
MVTTIRFQIPRSPTGRESDLPPEVDPWVETQVDNSSLNLRDLKKLVQSRWYDLLQSVGRGYAAPEVDEIELRWDGPGPNELIQITDTTTTQSTTDGRKVLLLLVEPVTKYTIFFKTQSTSGPVRVGDDDTVASLKERVNDKMGFVNVAPPRWSVVDLTQGVKMGDENKRMKEYGVEEDDTLFFKFKGYPGRDSRFRIGWNWPFFSLQKKNKLP